MITSYVLPLLQYLSFVTEDVITSVINMAALLAVLLL
jgi:hypothetical protein